MTSIGEHLDNYFSSLNPITRKIWLDLENVKKAYGEEEWNQLDPVQQEEILAKYMIIDEIRDKYAHIDKDPTPEVFPRLRINCGERIVVDFENDDGWTWQDEHSGPFSWMNKSQQDLTLDELDSLEEQIKKTKRGVSRSPDRDPNNKRQWDAAAGKGANPEAANTADEIFQKFGIAFSFGNDEEENQDGEFKPDHSEQAELLPDIPEQHDNDNFVADEGEFTENQSGFGSSLRDDTLSDSYACSELSSHRTSTASSTSSSRKKKSSRSRESKSEAELCLMDDPLNYGGEVSPAYVEDLGESMTDQEGSSQFNYDVEIHSDSPSVLGSEINESTSNRSSVVCSQPVAISEPVNTAWQTNVPDTEEKEDETELDEGPLSKTGFDFLDNW